MLVPLPSCNKSVDLAIHLQCHRHPVVLHEVHQASVTALFQHASTLHREWHPVLICILVDAHPITQKITLE
jgi:hypothetical protein